MYVLADPVIRDYKNVLEGSHAKECITMHFNEFNGQDCTRVSERLKFASGRLVITFCPKFDYLLEQMKMEKWKPSSGDTDFKISCAESEADDNVKYEFHKEYLSKISDPFQAMLSSNSSFKEFKNGEMFIKATEFINGTTIKKFHKVLYEKDTGKKDFTIGLLLLAERYQIESIYIICCIAIEELILDEKNRENISRSGFMINGEDHIIEVLKAANMLNDKSLFKTGIHFVHRNFKLFEKTKEFEDFMNENSNCYKEFVRYIMHNTKFT